MKKLLKVCGVFLIIFLVFTGACFGFLLMGKNKTLNLQIGSVDLSNVEDGVYHGKYSGYRWTTEVEVTVQNHEITKIDIIKNPVFNPVTAREVADNIIDQNKIPVEVVSGATVDSKALMKAVENALTGDDD